MPSVSIAMATYNGAAYLQAQLDSFAAQTRRPDELVVCDDCSTDDTLRILERFKAEAPFRVRIHVNENNLGYVRNFEKALSLCEGNFIFLSDQDDVWLPEKIGRVLSAFAAEAGLMVVMNDQIITDAELVPTGTTKLRNLRRIGLPESSFVTGCCSACRKEWLSLALPIPEIPTPHDQWINELAHSLGVARILDAPLQYYRRHSSNVSSNPISSQREPGHIDRFAVLGRLAFISRPATQTHAMQREEAILERLACRREELAEMDLAAPAEKLSAALRRRLDARGQRSRLASLPRLKRVRPIARLLRSGAYGQFSGWKSAVVDLVRARAMNDSEPAP